MKKLYLEKQKRFDKLTKKDQEGLVFDLVYAIVEAKNISDVTLFLQDLLTKNELKMLSKRLRIAKLLLAGMTYVEIQKQLHVSHSTVAKIGAWLLEKGDGFRKIIKKIPKEEKSIEVSEWSRLKKRHSLYFWPELLLEEVVKSASNKNKSKIKSVLDRLEEKNELHRKIEKLLR